MSIRIPEQAKLYYAMLRIRLIEEVLAEAGATIEDVVKITAYITDMDRYAEYAEARAEAFPKNLPASATVSTPVLVNSSLLVEVEATAEIGSGA